MAQQPLKSFDRPLMTVSLSDSREIFNNPCPEPNQSNSSSSLTIHSNIIGACLGLPKSFLPKDIPSWLSFKLALLTVLVVKGKPQQILSGYPWHF